MSCTGADKQMVQEPRKRFESLEVSSESYSIYKGIWELKTINLQMKCVYNYRAIYIPTAMNFYGYRIWQK